MTPRVFEEHSSVLAHWWALGQEPRTIVYLDAHLDLQPVSPQALARLQACRTAAEIAALERPHPLCPGDAWAYGLEDWILPAHRLGLIERLVWVVPPHVGASFDATALAQLSQMDGVTPDDLLSFRRDPSGCIVGTLLGVPITICSLDQVGAAVVPAGAIVDIDIDYFIAVPGDRPWVNPAKVFAALQAMHPAPGAVAISRSVGSGFTPLRYRFVADWLAALWSADLSTAAHFERLFMLEQARDGASPADVATQARAEALAQPSCAATMYLLGRATPDGPEAAQWQERAQQAELAYGPDILRDAYAYRNRSLNLDLATVLRLERELEAQPQDTPRCAWTWAAIGLLHVAFERLDAARHCFKQCESRIGPHPQLALEIGRLALRAGRVDEARGYLELALPDAENAVAATMLLARLHASQGALAKTLALLDELARHAPAWADVPRMQREVCTRLGRLDEARRHEGRVRALDAVALQVAQQLA